MSGSAAYTTPLRAALGVMPAETAIAGTSPSNMGYYTRHIFFCTNRRDGGEQCCAASGSEALRAFAKQRAKELGISGPGAVRVNTSGCLDRCSEGPVAVVYPEGVWYTYADEADVAEIVEEHLQHGRIVARLKL